MKMQLSSSATRVPQPLEELGEVQPSNSYGTVGERRHVGKIDNI